MNFVSAWRNGGRAPTEPPLRAEVLDLERLQDHARALAARFTIDPRRRRRRLLARLEDNARVLGQTYRLLADDVRGRLYVSPAGEWMLDNYHLVVAEIRALREYLPRRYYAKLPTLAATDRVGDVRAYALAVEVVRHSDSRLDRQQLVAFLTSYQTVAPLTIGELWAFPSMLRLALLENLRRLADEILLVREARQAADRYVSRLEEGAP
jgi:cyclic beta-1,2-glucan synthetase